jgi:hypothetical protein
MCLLCLPWYMRDCSGDQRLVTGLHRLLGPGLTHTLNLRTAAACMGRRRAAARGSRARRRCARPPTRRWCRARWPRATTSSSPAPPRAPRCTGRSSLRWRCPGARLLRHRPPVTLPPAQRLPCPKLQGPWILSRAQRPSAGRRQLPRGAACRSRACRAAAPGMRPAKPASIPPAPAQHPRRLALQRSAAARAARTAASSRRCASSPRWRWAPGRPRRRAWTRAAGACRARWTACCTPCMSRGRTCVNSPPGRL